MLKFKFILWFLFLITFNKGRLNARSISIVDSNESLSKNDENYSSSSSTSKISLDHLAEMFKNLKSDEDERNFQIDYDDDCDEYCVMLKKIIKNLNIKEKQLKKNIEKSTQMDEYDPNEEYSDKIENREKPKKKTMIELISNIKL